MTNLLRLIFFKFTILYSLRQDALQKAPTRHYGLSKAANPTSALLPEGVATSTT